MPLTIKPAFIFLVLAFILSGCVTTMEGGREPVDEKKSEKTYVDAGFAYLRQNDKESARRHFLRAVKVNSRSAGALNGLAIIYQIDKVNEKADEHFRKAILLEPSNSRARNNYSSFLYVANFGVR